jgi:hypothetical protein
LGQAKGVHQTLDAWAPAPETAVTQIAGWGLYTVTGLKVVDEKKCEPSFGVGYITCSFHDGITVQDKVTLNGDATVLVPSALDMATSSTVKNYWVDLATYNQSREISFLTERKHRNIFEVDTLRPFINCLIKNTICDTSDDYVSSSEPAPLNKAYTKYTIHSPLNLTVTDSAGRVTGFDPGTGAVTESIKGAQYFEIGDIKTVLIPKDTTHAVKLSAYQAGSFTLDIQELSGETVIQETKFEAIPTLEQSVVTVTPATVTTPAEMALDFQGDGTVDTNLTVLPGETVAYANPTPADTTPPETTIALSGTQGTNGWYRSSVQITLTTEPGASTEYNLNNTWQPYINPFTISQEGTTVLQYRSTDQVGNIEAAKTQEIKIDTKAPEALITFDITTEQLKVSGKEDSIIVTSGPLTYTLTDQAGNTTLLTFTKIKEKERKHKGEYVLQSIQYNQTSPRFQKDTRQNYFYKEERRRDEARAFTASLQADKERLIAHYVKKKNQTYIMEKTENEQDDPETCDKRKVKKILSGLVIPYFETGEGKVSIKY